MIKNYIKNESKVIQIICNEEVFNKIKKEYGEYYKFTINSKKYDFCIYIYIDEEKYRKVLNSNLNINYRNVNYLKDRDEIIIKINEKEIFILYNKITDNLIQFVGENIISIFGIMMEKEGYHYFHAACVEKNNKGIMIIGERHSGKTTILNMLLQEKFNFISNSHLGVKIEGNKGVAIGSPSRMGMRVETLKHINNKKIKKEIIEKTEFKTRFGENTNIDLPTYSNKKFNIKINEIKQLYKVELKNKVEIKLIIVPHYIENTKDIQIRQLNEFEKRDALLRNKRKGSYDAIRYFNSMSEIKDSKTFQAKNIEMYKIYQNEKNINQLIKFINEKIEN